MLKIDPRSSTLLVIDFQTRLMPAIDQGADVVANAKRLIDAAAIIGVPALFTEQNANGLGPTVPELAPDLPIVAHKMTFDACCTAGFLERLAANHALVVAGCEAHVCVLQTVLGLIGHGRKALVVRDALGSRSAENKETAIRRMERCGAQVVTTEMVVFEWLETAEHPRFREAISLIK
ncbi:MAG: isochorismatase family protein [Acetobacteraceae bacterium]|nr:isochorismatase family protein [Acetobacteraceae bacterium]